MTCLNDGMVFYMPNFIIMLDTLLFKMMVLAKHYPLANSYNAIVLKALKHRFKKREVRFIRTYLIILLNSLLIGFAGSGF